MFLTVRSSPPCDAAILSRSFPRTPGPSCPGVSPTTTSQPSRPGASPAPRGRPVPSRLGASPTTTPGPSRHLRGAAGERGAPAALARQHPRPFPARFALPDPRLKGGRHRERRKPRTGRFRAAPLPPLARGSPMPGDARVRRTGAGAGRGLVLFTAPAALGRERWQPGWSLCPRSALAGAGFREAPSEGTLPAVREPSSSGGFAELLRGGRDAPRLLQRCLRSPGKRDGAVPVGAQPLLPVPSSTTGRPGSPGSRHHSGDASAGPSAQARPQAAPAPGTKLSRLTPVLLWWCPGPRCHLHALAAPQPPPCPSPGTDVLGKRHPCFEKTCFLRNPLRTIIPGGWDEESPQPALITHLPAPSSAPCQRGSAHTARALQHGAVILLPNREVQGKGHFCALSLLQGPSGLAGETLP